MNDFDDIQCEDVYEGEHDMTIFEDDGQPDTYSSLRSRLLTFLP